MSITSDTAAVRDCLYKGIIDDNPTDLYSDVQAVRAPDVRLRTAKLGGNVLLRLPGRGSMSPKATEKAVVYQCSDLTPLKSPVAHP